MSNVSSTKLLLSAYRFNNLILLYERGRKHYATIMSPFFRRRYVFVSNVSRPIYIPISYYASFGEDQTALSSP